MPLNKLPKAFNLQGVKKGEFPFQFNTTENQDYVGPMPPIQSYDIDGKKPEDREKFLRWYDEMVVAEKQFDFQAKLIAYCKNDVDVLRLACLEFRKLFMGVSKARTRKTHSADHVMCSFRNAITISSACMTLFQRNFMKEDTIGLIPSQGYVNPVKSSRKAERWLKYKSNKLGQQIKHAGNSGEFQIGTLRVDGYVERLKLALEFYGCFYHGCPKCYSEKTVNPINGLAMAELYERTQNRRKLILAAGYNLEEIWECDYDRQIKSDSEMREYIESLHEVWHYSQTTTYDKENANGGLFTEYINTFLKMKQEASGYPDWCKTESDKTKYIDDYYEREGILLDRENISANPAMRSLFKLLLNSFWGKFGQRDNLPQSVYISDLQSFYDILNDDKKEVSNVYLVNEELINVTYTESEEFVRSNPRSSVVLACYTTSQARLKLYETLEKFQEDQLLYFDTDSCIYISRSGQYDPELGSCLGEFTDELAGNFITTFVSAGPKCYAYQLAPDCDGKVATECKKSEGRKT
ncbi:uncharacterized protein [Ptychodera flava]|uniref:uncharacterized protein n=1 Tax=Ptychodera flava TaxID=63121 RepID=UPI00396A4664